MTRKKRFVLITFILLVSISIFFILGCNGGKKEIGKKKEADIFKVGVILPMTGNLGFIGEFEKKSFNLATGDNTKIKMIYEDSKGSPKDAVNAAQKLLNVDKVSVIISSLSFLSESIEREVEEAKIPHFILSFSPELPHKSEYIFRYFTSSTGEAKQFVDYILKGGYKRIAFIRHIEPDADNAFYTITKPNLEKESITLQDEPFSLDTKDFSGIIQRIKEGKPDLVVIQAFSFLIPQIMRKIKEYQINAPILGDLNFIDIERFPESESKLVEGIPFTGVGFVFEEKFKTYATEYEKKFNDKAYVMGAFCYDLGISLVEYFNKNKSTDPTSIVAFFKGRKYDGASGETYLDQNGEFHMDYQLLTYKNGKIVKYEE
jgi:branched-chain amino acid transport system substrate-binding protein